MKLIELTEDNFLECVELTVDAAKSCQLLLLPTDTVYGLGGLAFSRKVLDKMLRVKPDRDVKPTAILIDNIIRMSQIAGDVPSPKIVKLAETFWPGPLTMVWKTSGVIPEEFRTKDQSLGYRIPNSDFLIEVMRRLEQPLWATSANLPGQSAPRLFSEIRTEVIEACDFVVKTKKLLTGRASAIVDVRGREPTTLRESALRHEDILRIWKQG
jgi:L-threonylcarbamoyladenylate synthase